MPREYNETQRKELAKKAMDIVVEAHNKKSDVVIALFDNSPEYRVYYSTNTNLKVNDVLVNKKGTGPQPVFCPKGMVWNDALQKCVPENPDLVELKIADVEFAADYDKVNTTINNLFDGLKVTRFSVKSPAPGVPAYVLTLDLGGEQEVSELGISCYKGGDRKYFIDAQLSNEKTIFNYSKQIETSGATDEMEFFKLGVDPIKCRYVRILGRGNTINEWNSYTGLKIRGRESTPIVVTPPPKPDPEGDLDKNGIKKFYKTDASKPSWYLGDQDVNKDPELTLDGDNDKDSEFVTAKHPTIGNIYTAKSREGGLASGGTQQTMRLHWTPLSSKGTQKASDKYHEEIKARGYMISPQDVKDIEQTAIFRLRGIMKEKGRVSHKQHGGIHTGNDDPRASCLGMVVQFKEDDKRLAELELNHPKYMFFEVPKLIAGINMKSLENQWLGTKCISITKGDDVYETLLINTNPFNNDGTVNNNNWTPYAEFVFKVGLKDTNGDAITMTPTWGGIVTTWRINEVKEVDFRSLSVRSILAT